ncbi:hypothetical protein [Psychroserpens luteolus]|uniref:hypothetical protein n=1 Tax=Psychroserpens luteolus TaxID=2855840 RepID=UPI001E3ACBDE|nr:hypothetical protein [Psychroserpens luteolus]MCD2258770.1 hypothetical protein [Psychroserpens luteolus]
MKNLLKNAIACAIVMTTCFNCSVESIESDQFDNSILENQNTQDPCSDQDPQARITNNGTVSITLQIANIDGTLLHTVSNLAPGDASGYLTFSADDIIFNVSKNTTGISDEKVVYTMDQCMSFDMEVDVDNYLTSSTPQNL